MNVNYDAYGWSRLTDKDREELRLLLGREPHPVIAVARRSKSGRPQVIVNDPLPVDKHGQTFPFPTLFWLVSPVLVRAVDRLESEGWIDRLRKMLIHDTDEIDGVFQKIPKPSDARNMMVGAHRDTARLRLKLADASLLGKMKSDHPMQYDVLAQTGVAGLRHDDGVKCLHAHLADYLGRPRAKSNTINPVGRLVAELLAERGQDIDA